MTQICDVNFMLLFVAPYKTCLGVCVHRWGSLLVCFIAVPIVTEHEVIQASNEKPSKYD